MWEGYSTMNKTENAHIFILMETKEERLERKKARYRALAAEDRRHEEEMEDINNGRYTTKDR